MVGNFLSRSLGTRSIYEDLAVRFAGSGWSILTASSKPGRMARLLDMLSTTLIKRRQYDAAMVDVYSGHAFFWAEAVCAALRIIHKPFLLTLQGGNLPVFAQRWPRRVRRLLQRAAIVTVPSSYLLEKMRPFRADLLLIPFPVNVKMCEYRVRSQLQPRLIWMRAFRTIYNPSLAPRVLGLLTHDFPNARLTMIGPDKKDGSLQATQDVSRELDIAGLIDFSGPVPKQQVPLWINTGDIFLNTTDVDNAPVSVMEAMACGLCVVSTNVGGIPYLLAAEHDALLVPANNPEAMAKAVHRILTEPGLAERLSVNARKKVEQFDWSVILPQWQALLAALTEKRKASRKTTEPRIAARK